MLVNPAVAQPVLLFPMGQARCQSLRIRLSLLVLWRSHAQPRAAACGREQCRGWEEEGGPDPGDSAGSFVYTIHNSEFDKQSPLPHMEQT